MNIRERAQKKKIPRPPRIIKTQQNRVDSYNSLLWKPTEIPDGFILVVDSREQHPLFDPIPIGLCIIRDAIKVGDYTVKGFENQIAIERKGESDFFGFIGRERDRTVKKLEAMSKMYFSALVIQVDEYDLYNPSIPTKLTHEHVRGFLKSIRVKYGIHYYMNEDKESLERYVLDSCTYVYSQLRNVESNKT
jgi:ERCC4-type nuclease